MVATASTLRFGNSTVERMDGIHDLGGMNGFGPVDVEADEPTFHAPWEALAFKMNLLSIGLLRLYNADEYRHAIERMKPGHYLSASYYERVLTGVATLLVEKGVVDREDLNRRVGGEFLLAQPVKDNAENDVSAPDGPAFAVGDEVRVATPGQPGHTRAPRYIRGCTGTVVHVAPPFRYPDNAAHGLARRKEATYHVEFAAVDLWADVDNPVDTVVVDLWESYLEASRGE